MRAYVGYGGTFDPVHCGHLAVAQAVASRLGADVHLVPAADPPHKAATHAAASHRRRMLELAVAGERTLHVDPRELGREGPSYTVDTLAALREELGPEASIVWIVGADSLEQLHRWSRWQRLFTFGHVLAVGRPGHASDATHLLAAEDRADGPAFRELAPGQLLDQPSGGLAVLGVQPPRTESSTGIRDLIGSGQPWRHLVPAPVAAYIDRHRLYAPLAAA